MQMSRGPWLRDMFMCNLSIRGISGIPSHHEAAQTLWAVQPLPPDLRSLKPANAASDFLVHRPHRKPDDAPQAMSDHQYPVVPQMKRRTIGHDR